jgi:abortive infection bacteriophage resistance protein
VEGDGIHVFKTSVRFADVVGLYEFDRELRLLVLAAIERIEIGFRTAASHYLCTRYGPLWFLRADVFCYGFDHASFQTELEESLGLEASTGRRREQFLDHYYKKYTEPEHPPGWMMAEIWSLGTWSRTYKCLRDVLDQKAIARELGCPHVLLESWLHAVTYVRNCCAHHSRLWNRQFTIRPKLSAEILDANLTWLDTSFAAQAIVMQALLTKLAPVEQWPRRLAGLFDRYPRVKANVMGFPRNWRKQDFWKLAEPQPPAGGLPVANPVLPLNS